MLRGYYETTPSFAAGFYSPLVAPTDMVMVTSQRGPAERKAAGADFGLHDYSQLCRAALLLSDG